VVDDVEVVVDYLGDAVGCRSLHVLRIVLLTLLLGSVRVL
jgi:hypothetical protein